MLSCENFGIRLQQADHQSLVWPSTSPPSSTATAGSAAHFSTSSAASKSAPSGSTAVAIAKVAVTTETAIASVRVKSPAAHTAGSATVTHHGGGRVLRRHLLDLECVLADCGLALKYRFNVNINHGILDR